MTESFGHSSSGDRFEPSRRSERGLMGKRSGVFRRGFWGLVSQGANAFGNLLAAVFVASHCSSQSFGAWSVGYACVLAALPISRSVGATPMLLTSHKHQPQTERGAVACGLWFGLIAGAVLAVSSMFINGQTGPALLAFSVALPLFLFQDTLRYVFISRQRTSRTAVMDVTWLLLQLIGFGILLATDLVNGPATTIVWAVSALLSCAWAIGSGSISLSPRVAYAFTYKNRWAGSRLTPDAILNGISSNAVPVLLAAVGGLSSTAALRAGQTLFGPLNIVVAGLSPVITVEAVRSLRAGGSQWRLVRNWSVALALVGLLFATAIYVIPDSLGERLLGESWSLVPMVVLPLSIQALVRGPFVCGPLVLRARHLLNEMLALRVVSSSISLAIPAAGVFIDGARGAAWGIAIAAVLRGAVTMLWLRRTQDRLGRDLADDGEDALSE